MLPVVREGECGPLLVMLHWLGGGAQTWREVSHGLARRGFRCAALDLPGFGEAADMAPYDVGSMADAVIETVRALRAEFGGPWLLAGHSMGGKVAAVVARNALSGAASGGAASGLEDLRGLLLVSPSPPGPEPMLEAKREKRIAVLGQSSGDAGKDRHEAATFVDQGTGTMALPPGVRERAMEGVLAMNRAAFRHWMEVGSKEDWREFVGVLDLPTLVFAGTEEHSLGPSVQQQHTLPHLGQVQLIALQQAAHLGLLERPGELIERITMFVAGFGLTLPVNAPGLTPRFAQLLASERTAPQTRAAMQVRLDAAQNWNHQPQAFTRDEFLTLRAFAERVVPDAGFDLAARIDAELASSDGDGWRYAALPADSLAWKRGLRSLDIAAERAHGLAFLSLSADQQDALLTEAVRGRLGPGLPGTLHVGAAGEAYAAEAMKQWFEDARAMCTRLYMGDPRTMDALGYAGFADDLGFTQIRLGEQGAENL